MHGPPPSPAGVRGFTVVELLVVVLIIATLAAIAMPLFLGQRQKGEDTKAQAMVRTVAITLATYQADHGTFAATKEQLIELEPAIAEASPDLAVSGTSFTFEIAERSGSTTVFTLRRAADGTTTRTCSIPGRGLCRADSSW